MYTMTIKGAADVPTDFDTAERIKDLVRRLVDELEFWELDPVFINLADEGSYDEDLFGTDPDA